MIKKSNTMTKSVVTMVDDKHSIGRAVVSNDIITYILQVFGMKIHRITYSRTMKVLGLHWALVKTTRRTYASYRTNSIREFLIDLDLIQKGMNARDSDEIFVFLMNHIAI